MPEFNNYINKAKKLRTSFNRINLKKCFHILFKAVFYFILFLATVALLWPVFDNLGHIINIISVKYFDVKISFLGNGLEREFCRKFILFLEHLFNFILLFSIVYCTDMLKGKKVKFIALISGILNLIFAIIVITATQTELLTTTNSPDWKEYFLWFDKGWKVPFSVLTSSLIGYFCLAVSSEKIYIPLPKKMKDVFLKKKLGIFYFLINSYFVLFILFGTLWKMQCNCPYHLNGVYTSKYKPHQFMFISHSMGIYGFISNKKLKCKGFSIHCGYGGDRLY